MNVAINAGQYFKQDGYPQTFVYMSHELEGNQSAAFELRTRSCLHGLSFKGAEHHSGGGLHTWPNLHNLHKYEVSMGKPNSQGRG